MLDIGLYSILLKWGLDSVGQVVRDKDPNHLQILLEAIKTRNALVLRRFDFAWAAAQEIADLVDEVETALAPLLAGFQKVKAKKVGMEGVADHILHTFHPTYYRKLRKARAKLEATNDLFSAYSLEFLEMLRSQRLKELLVSAKCETVSDMSRTYRHIWGVYSTVISLLLRVTSYDLRFWLADISYFEFAHKRANVDRALVEEHLRSNSDRIWTLSIENRKIVDEMWELIQATDQGKEG